MLGHLRLHPGRPVISGSVVSERVVCGRVVAVCADHGGGERESDDCERHEQPAADGEVGHCSSPRLVVGLLGSYRRGCESDQENVRERV